MRYVKMAKELAAQGRGKDKYLLHVTKQELEDLEKTGLLTYNPETGLPEAGFFSSLFSFAAPIVGGLLGGPVGAAIGGGLGSAVKGGNPLIGAAGGYLGSSLGGYLGDAFGGVGEGVAEGLVPSVPEISESFFGDALGGTFGESTLGALASGAGASAGAGFDSWFDTSPLSFGGGGGGGGGSLGFDSLGMGTFSPLTAPAAASTMGDGGLLERLRRLPWKNIAGGLNVAQSLYGFSQANKLQQLAQQQASQADPYGPYRAQAAQRLAQLTSNPSMISEMPGYQAGLQAVQRGLAGSGYLGSGNEKVALLKYGGDIYNQEVQRLAQLAGAQFSPANASQIALSGTGAALNLKGNTLNNLARNIYGWGTS